MVASQCDEAMQSLDVDWLPNWRDRYHVDDLNKVLNILEIPDRQQSNVFAVKQWPSTGGLSRVRRGHPILDKPLPPLPSPSDGTGSLEPSPNSSMSWTPTNSSYTAGVSSHTTSPTNASPASASPTSPSSGSPTVVRCRSCSLDFTGKDALTNYRRHLRSSRRHDRKAGLRCPLPECNHVMRSDNLRSHLQGKHKISDEQERHMYIEMAKKTSAVAVDGNGRTRRNSRRQSSSSGSVTLVDDSPMALF